MSDLPELVDTLLDDPQLRDELGARGRERVRSQHEWATVARIAEFAYHDIVAARSAARSNRDRTPIQRSDDPRPAMFTSTSAGAGEDVGQDGEEVGEDVAELARRTPYWLAEWRSRDPRFQDGASMTGPPPSSGEPGGVAVDIDCARLAATAALGVGFDTEAAAGYAGRSMVFLAPEAVLKVYTHRAGERAAREVAGLELAHAHAPHLSIPEVVGHDDVPGGLSWVATTRLPGHHPGRGQLADDAVARGLGRLAARLHAIGTEHLAGLPTQARRIRDLPVGHPAGADAARRLVEALDAAEPHQRPRCELGFVHGDLSSRNVLLPTAADLGDDSGTPPSGVIDFEGSGQDCVYDDLATLVMQDGLLGPAEVDQLLGRYQDERSALGHPRAEVSPEHLALHLGWRARWILQWAIEIDPPLTEQVLALTPTLLADLTRARQAGA